MIKKIFLSLILLNGSLLFAAKEKESSAPGEGESGCRILLDKYFTSVRSKKTNNKIENLINEACTGISEVDKENPFVCSLMEVREKQGEPLEAVEKCVNKYKGKWGRYM
jgi:hypothetical protein